MLEMIRECLEAWRLRAALYLVCSEHPGDDQHVDVVQALLNLRSHFAGCQQCKKYLRSYTGRSVPMSEGGE